MVCANNIGDSGDLFYGSKPVALRQPNAFGLFDMIGGIWEMTQDNYIGHETSQPSLSIPIFNQDPPDELVVEKAACGETHRVIYKLLDVSRCLWTIKWGCWLSCGDAAMMLFGLLTWLACANKCDSTFTDLAGDDIDQNCDGIDGTDGDGDGSASWQSGGSDCDDTDPTVSSGALVYQDLDQDGFGNPIYPSGSVMLRTWVPSTLSTDCNDFNASIHPEHPEVRHAGQ